MLQFPLPLPPELAASSSTTLHGAQAPSAPAPCRFDSQLFIGQKPRRMSTSEQRGEGVGPHKLVGIKQPSRGIVERQKSVGLTPLLADKK